jgi:dTDP-4-dehydrorhamnose 3,5-epimerase
VAVDLRRSSASFGRWTGIRLSAENRLMRWIPAGFAHGFLVVSEHADVLYKTTAYWSREHERSVAWNDRDIGIQWPLTTGPFLSEKDARGLALRNAEVFA